MAPWQAPRTPSWRHRGAEAGTSTNNAGGVAHDRRFVACHASGAVSGLQVLLRPILQALFLGALTVSPAPIRAAECSPLKLLTTLDLHVVGGHRPGVDVEVNGTPRTFLIDTGASMVAPRST